MTLTWAPLLFPRPQIGFLLLMPFSVAAAHIRQVLKCLMKLSTLFLPAHVEGKAGLLWPDGAEVERSGFWKLSHEEQKTLRVSYEVQSQAHSWGPENHSKWPSPVYWVLAMCPCSAKHLNDHLWGRRCQYSYKETGSEKSGDLSKVTLSGRVDIWSQVYYLESSKTKGIEIQLKLA